MNACTLCGRPVTEAHALYCCPGCAAIARIVTNLRVDDREKQPRIQALPNALSSASRDLP